MMRRLLVPAVLALSAAALVACGDGDDQAEPQGGSQSTVPEQTDGTGSEEPSAEPSAEPSVDDGRLLPPTVVGEVATGLAIPWSVAFLPDGTALVSERGTAKIKLLDGQAGATEVGEVPDVAAEGEGGLLGLAISPDFATDQLVYAYHTSPSDNRVVRMTFDGTVLGSPEVILDGIASNTIHNGGRIHFGPDGMLYAGVGDAGDPATAQDTGSLSGKILRMAPDGAVPPDNPFDNLVWSYGHRNVQGFGWAEDGTMWASEFGQSAFDELNRIEAGANYGWPVAEGIAELAGMVDPVVQWGTDDASPSGLAVVDGQVYLAALKGERLWQVPGPGGTGTSLEPVAWFTGEYGRLRDVVEAPDRTLWLVTNNTDGRGDPRDGDDRILQVQRVG